MNLLDNFYNKNIYNIESEYYAISLRPEFRGGDPDKLFVIILNEFLNFPHLFDNNELKLLSTLINMRESSGYIEFKKIYPILRNLILLSNINTRDEDIFKISSVIRNPVLNNVNNYVNFSNIYNEYPIMKNIIMNVSSSPSDGNEYINDLLKIPIEYGSNDKY